MPAAKQQTLAANVEAVARSCRSSHLKGIPSNAKSPDVLPGAVDIATGSANVSTVCRTNDRQLWRAGMRLIFRQPSADASARSRGTILPELSVVGPPSIKRAQGMPDARCTRSRLCRKKHRRQQLQVHRNNRHSLRNGFNGVLRALPGDRACLPPSSMGRTTDLAPASGRQNHTTSPSAEASLVRAMIALRHSASIASRSQRP
jgi:hypothetical protein